MEKKQVVLDSSVIVKFIFSEGEANLPQADAILAAAKNGTTSLAAPTLAKYEIGNVIRFRKISKIEKQTCWDNFESLPIKYFDLNFSDGSQSQEIAEKAQITFYDAVFVTLAKKLKTTLITANPKHQGRFDDVKVIDLKNYR